VNEGLKRKTESETLTPYLHRLHDAGVSQLRHH